MRSTDWILAALARDETIEQVPFAFIDPFEKSEIRGHENLERIINLLPPALEGAGDAELGNPAVMSPDALRLWLRGVLER